MKKVRIILTMAFVACILLGCKKNDIKPPFLIEYLKVDGIVIGKEKCKNNQSQDYWLISFNPIDTKPFGNQITLEGKAYTNVMKTLHLPIDAKKVGQKILIEYVSLNDVDIETTGCEVADPLTFTIHEMLISRCTLK